MNGGYVQRFGKVRLRVRLGQPGAIRREYRPRRRPAETLLHVKHGYGEKEKGRGRKANERIKENPS